VEDWRDVQLKIIEILSQVEGVSYVLGYEPHVKTFEELKPFLTRVTRKIDTVNVWFVQRARFRTERGGVVANVPLGFKKDTDSFSVDGFISYTGEDSLISFNNIIEGIRTTFTQNISLGSPEKGWLSGPILEGRMDMAEFLGILCHSCSFIISVQEDTYAGYR
jgi:hypothetical protein